MALVQFGSLKIFSRKPLVTLDVLSDFLFGRWKLRNCAKLEPGSLANKVVLVTGCNAGIGYALCLKLAKAQARLLICCRTIEKAKATADRLKKEYGVYSKDCFRCFGADLEDLTAVKKLAHDILELNESIDLLVLNAGVMQAAKKRLTRNGLELHFAVNHLGPFLLTYLLMPLLRTSAPCTVIIVTSNAYEYGKPEQLIDHRFQNFLYTAVFAYAQSKLANVLFAYELKKRMKDKGVEVFAVHPGAVLSDIYREEWLLHTPVLGSLTKKLLSWIMRTPVEGATATVAPFANPSHFSRQDSYNDNYSNLYWRDCKPQAVNTHLVNDMWSEYLWRLSLSLLEDLGLLNGINRERLSTDP